MIRMKYFKPTCLGLLLLSTCALLMYLAYYRYSSGSGITQSGVFTKNLIWFFETQDTITASPVSNEQGKVFVRTANSIIALDVNNGQQLWQINAPSNTPLSVAPVVFGNYLITPEKDSQLAVFLTDTGKLAWQAPTINPGLTHPAAIDIVSIASGSNEVYVARFDANLTAYDVKSGRIVWQQDTSGRSSPYLALDNDTVYMGMGSLLKAFDEKTGALEWRMELDGYIGSMLMANQTLYIADEEYPSLLAIDLNNKKVKWRINLNTEQGEIQCMNMLGNDLFIAAKQLIKVSRLDGRTLWQTGEIGRLECPVLLNHTIYVRNTGTTLYAFGTTLGNNVGTLTVQSNTLMKHDPNRSPAVASNGLLIVPVNDHRIVAYRP